MASAASQATTELPQAIQTAIDNIVHFNADLFSVSLNQAQLDSLCKLINDHISPPSAEALPSATDAATELRTPGKLLLDVFAKILLWKAPTRTMCQYLFIAPLQTDWKVQATLQLLQSCVTALKPAQCEEFFLARGLYDQKSQNFLQLVESAELSAEQRQKIREANNWIVRTASHVDFSLLSRYESNAGISPREIEVFNASGWAHRKNLLAKSMFERGFHDKNAQQITDAFSKFGLTYADVQNDIQGLLLRTVDRNHINRFNALLGGLVGAGILREQGSDLIPGIRDTIAAHQNGSEFLTSFCRTLEIARPTIEQTAPPIAQPQEAKGCSEGLTSLIWGQADPARAPLLPQGLAPTK